MKSLVAPCGWIEWLTDGQLVDDSRPWLEAGESLVVPSSIQFQLYQWVCRERDEAMALEVIALTVQGRVVALTTSLALLAADVARQHGLSFADAMIDATARQEDVPRVTSDDPFEGLPGVVYLVGCIHHDPAPLEGIGQAGRRTHGGRTPSLQPRQTQA